MIGVIDCADVQLTQFVPQHLKLDVVAGETSTAGTDLVEQGAQSQIRWSGGDLGSHRLCA